MAEQPPLKGNKRASFMGSKFRSLRNLVSPTGKNPDVPSSVTPTRTKKKVRSRAASTTTGNGGRPRLNIDDLDDIIAPSAKAQHKHNLQQQLSQKQASVAAAVTNNNNKSGNKNNASNSKLMDASNKNNTSSSKLMDTSAASQSIKQASSSKLMDASAASQSNKQGMRQRLQDIESMIEKGKQEKVILQAAEATKIQALARGFLQRRRMNKPKKKHPKRNSVTLPAPTQAQIKKKRSKRASIKSTNSRMSGSSNKHHSPVEKKKTAATIKLQALARGFLLRQQHALLVHPKKPHRNKASNNASAKHNKKLRKAISVDHYAWIAHKATKNGDNDHYTWNREGSKKDMKDNHQNQDKNKDNFYAWDAVKEEIKDKDKKKTHHKDKEKDGKRVSETSKKSAGTLNNSSNNDLTKTRTSKVTSSGKAHKASRRSSSKSIPKLKDNSQESMKDESVPFQELVMDTTKKDSSGSMDYGVSSNIIPMIVEDEDVAFEDSEDSNDEAASGRSSMRSQQSFQSILSNLTNDDEDVDKQSHHAQKERRRRRARELQDDELSVSLLAVAPRASSDGSEDDDEEDYSDDDSRESYAYAPRYNKHKKSSGRRRRSADEDDDFSVSVMAVADMSDLEGESDYEYDDDESDYDNSDGEDMDFDDDLSDTVMAVALEGDSDDDDNSVMDNAREDDMSITSCETDLPRETIRRDRRRRRQEYDEDSDEEDDDDDDSAIDAEEVSVLSTASHKRHKRNHHPPPQQKSHAKKQTQKRKADSRQLQNQEPNLLGGFSSDSSKEESYQERKRRHRRSRRFMGNKSKPSVDVNETNEEELQRKLAEVNKLIAESRREMDQLKAEEATKIQAFVRMHRDRKAMASTIPRVRNALSRTGTKSMIAAAVAIQSVVRGSQARALVESQRRNKIRSRRNRKRNRAKEKAEEEQFRFIEEQQKAKDQAKLMKRLKEEEEELERRKEIEERRKEIEERMQRRAALEAEKAGRLQARARGFLVRSKDLLNPERIAAIKIQRVARKALLVVQLRSKLKTISEEREKELEKIEENRKVTIRDFEPGKFEKMDQLMKLVNYLKKQIEKENDNAEKLVADIKSVKETNVKLMTAVSANVSTVTRLEMDIESREEKRDALLKLNQEWLDGIYEYKARIENCISDTKKQQWQRDVHKKYCARIADLLETKSADKKLAKEVKFLSEHSDLATGGTGG